MRKLNYKGIEILLVGNLAFINKPAQAQKLGIFAGYSLSKLKKLIDKTK